MHKTMFVQQIAQRLYLRQNQSAFWGLQILWHDQQHGISFAYQCTGQVVKVVITFIDSGHGITEDIESAAVHGRYGT